MQKLDTSPIKNYYCKLPYNRRVPNNAILSNYNVGHSYTWVFFGWNTYTDVRRGYVKDISFYNPNQRYRATLVKKDSINHYWKDEIA